MALNTTQVKALISVETSGEERIRQLRKELEQLTRETGQLNSANTSGAKSDAIRRQSMIQLGQQMGDVGVQLQMGTSAARVFAMQAGQVGFALAGMGGALGRVGTFLAGPWGAALTIAISTLGMMVETLGAAEEKTVSLEEAEKNLASSMTELADSRERLDKALGRNVNHYEDLRRAAIEAGIAEVQAAQAGLAAADAQYKAMKRRRELNSEIIRDGGADVSGGAAILRMFGWDDPTEARAGLTQAIAETNEASSSLNNQVARLVELRNGPKQRKPRAARAKKPEKPIRESADVYAAETLGAWRRAWSRNDSDPVAEADISSTIKTEMLDLRSDGEKFLDGSAKAFKDYGKEIADIGGKAFAAWTNAMRATENAFVSFITTGKLSFSDLANSIIADIGRIAVQQAIIKPLTGFLQGLNLFQSANGSAFASGGVRAFASGGVVDSPTMFGYAGGLGVMGEAGAEAIMPLKRLSNGKLGVMSEGGSNNVTVNVNVEGGNTEVMGDQGKAAQLGNIIANAVRNELVVQKRPGGILAAA